jgi:flagellar basal body-associated protein FliL
VSLQGGDSGLMLNISIEVNSSGCMKDVAAKSPMLMDRVISVLSMKTPEELDSVVERNRLKRELLDDFNLQLKLDDGRLTNIYFRKFYYFKTDKPLLRD